MRSKILLLILSASVCLISCKKDKQTAPAPDPLAVIKTQILGTWQLTSGKEVYYDATGKVVKTDDQEVSAGAKYEFMDDSNLKRYDPSEQIFTYTLTNTNGKIFMSIDSVPYEVSINNDMMTWSIEQEIQNQEYSKVIFTFQLKKL